MILHFLSDLNTIFQIYKKYFKNNKNNNANEGYVYVLFKWVLIEGTCQRDLKFCSPLLLTILTLSCLDWCFR